MTTPLSDAGVGLLPMGAQSGARIVLTWGTDIRTFQSGLEQRNAYRSFPQQRYEFPFLLGSGDYRDTLALLQEHIAEGALFRLALPHEAVIARSSIGAAVTCYSLAACDWSAAGQRVLVQHPSGTIAETVLASAAGDVLTTDDDVSAVAVDGALVMPVMPVYLAAEQGFAPYQVQAAQLDLVAYASIAKLGDGTMGAGATVTTHDGLPVWDRGVLADPSAEQPIDSGATLINAGLRIGAIGNRTRPTGRRRLGFVGNRSEWQWLKAFVQGVRGRRDPFLCPTGRADFVQLSDASTGTLTVEGTDAATWYASTAHRRVRIVLEDGTSAIRTVTSVEDNGDGTSNLVLASAVSGAIAHVELVELVRFESDELAVAWQGGVYEAQPSAVVVQR